MSSHSRLAASKAGQWIRCPGSIAYVEWLKKENKIPEDTSNKWGELGTAVHKVLEIAIEEKIHPEVMPAKQLKKLTGHDLNERDIAGAQLAYNYVINIEKEYDEILAERKYDLSFVYDTDTGGTADISGFQDQGTLLIADYKNGKTVVEAEENYQLRIYALGAYYHENEWYNFQDVKTVIIQPNAPHRLGKIRADDFTIDELKKWEEKNLIPAINAIKNESATLIPGPNQCAWCEARHVCEANAKQSLQLAQIDFENVAHPKPELPAPKTLTKQQLSFILDNESRILQFLKACKAYAFETLEKGKEPIPYYHLEDKYSNRKLRDEKIVKKKIRENKLTIKEFIIAAEPKLMGVTQIEAYLKTKKWDKDKIAKFMDEVTERDLAGKELVRSNDSAQTEFAKLTTTKTLKNTGGRNGDSRQKRTSTIKSKFKRRKIFKTKRG